LFQKAYVTQRQNYTLCTKSSTGGFYIIKVISQVEIIVHAGFASSYTMHQRRNIDSRVRTISLFWW